MASAGRKPNCPSHAASRRAWVSDLDPGCEIVRVHAGSTDRRSCGGLSESSRVESGVGETTRDDDGEGEGEGEGGGGTEQKTWSVCV